MEYTTLGKTGLRISRLAFGAGPVADVMTGDDPLLQRALVQRVIESGINWIDTAAGYGNGRAELALGVALESLGAHGQVHLATKVRIASEDFGSIGLAVRSSFVASLKRLRSKRVALLQIHNSITAQRGDEPSSVTPADVLDRGGMLEAIEKLREEGSVRFIGITAIGQAEPLREVIDSGRFDTIQVPYSPMNPSAGQEVPPDFQEADYGNAIHHAARHGMGVFAIRVYAGGVMAGNPPSKHTWQTKFFPYDLFKRDGLRVARLRELLPPGTNLKELSVRYALSHPHVTAAIIGFSEPKHIDEAINYMSAGPLNDEVLSMLSQLDYHRIPAESV